MNLHRQTDRRTDGRTDGRTDRQTDGRTDRHIPIYPPEFCSRGYKNGHNIITSKNDLETGMCQVG